MKFSISVVSMQKAIKSLMVSVRPNAPDSTGRVLIEASETGVVFTVNNGTTAMTFSADANVSEPGTVSVAYNKIKSFVSSYKPWDETSGAKEFVFSLEANKIKIVVDSVCSDGKIVKGRLSLQNANVAVFPKSPAFGQPDFVLNSTIFISSI